MALNLTLTDSYDTETDPKQQVLRGEIARFQSHLVKFAVLGEFSVS